MCSKLIKILLPSFLKCAGLHCIYIWSDHVSWISTEGEPLLAPSSISSTSPVNTTTPQFALGSVNPLPTVFLLCELHSYILPAHC